MAGIFRENSYLCKMASCKVYIKANNKDKTNIRYRISDGKSVDLSFTSKIEINPNHWDAKKECLKAKVVMSPAEKHETNMSINEYREIVLTAYNNLLGSGEGLTSKNLKLYVDYLINPDKNKISSGIPITFFDVFDKYIETSLSSLRRKQNYHIVRRTLTRFEAYKQKQNRNFHLSFERISADVLREFEKYLLDEVDIVQKYPELLALSPDSRKPSEKGFNYIANLFKILKAFYNWARKNEYTTTDPFVKFENRGQIYGTPYYLTIDERNRLKDYDLSCTPHLERQRDIFVFQCLVGCRVGDLLKLKKSNVIGGNLQYIANKTHTKAPETIIVPLHKFAIGILNKYKDLEGDKLLPFISAQKYNVAIKDVLKRAGIDRMVTILNPTTRLQEQKPLYEVVSSHIGRKTFAGNLYKKVKDPNLIGALTGHSEGSRAFARYRTIDEDLKKSVIDLLDD
ncbi:MAG: site-specific integrase [Bacteroidales bacterium]|jgi:integrase|nr:site-specific integrase [Bacteroidales bacterium]